MTRFVLVSVEATEEMCLEGLHMHASVAGDCWREMLASAPPPSAEDVDGLCRAWCLAAHGGYPEHWRESNEGSWLYCGISDAANRSKDRARMLAFLTAIRGATK